MHRERQDSRHSSIINAISSCPDTRRAWRYLVTTNYATLVRHLYGYIQDHVAPAFWSDVSTQTWLKGKAMMMVELGDLPTTKSQSSSHENAAKECLRDEMLQDRIAQMDEYTETVLFPWNVVNPAFPFTKKGTRRWPSEIYNCFKLVISDISQVPLEVDASKLGAVAATGVAQYLFATIDDIPASCQWG
ncbi:hypothetical protein TWF694_002614 [Orbilia ellipsospora]|uniref:Uncharacterized protein n=1 Tax=Orbilia ellipsospora TaxID=2528407 RepID=A0AAV9X3W6_9PEZI